MYSNYSGVYNTAQVQIQAFLYTVFTAGFKIVGQCGDIKARRNVHCNYVTIR